MSEYQRQRNNGFHGEHHDAYSQNKGNRQKSNYSQNNDYRKNSDYRQEHKNLELTAEEIPVDYVDRAERVMRGLGKKQPGGNYKFELTTSKIRNIFSLSTDIYNVESRRREPELKPESVSALQKMRVRILYDAGREGAVKSFVEAAHLLQYIKGIGSDREKFINFANYMEALVAYHRFLGGDDA
ncbi:type III-A CRISPR-associated protein Csm2 [Diplocloster hominis]|uniref:type III-A CRISPR-associated protein Csm2 n=1 Tax=Diplocloster hominis TaxID=3079010 RepID=UPI0031BBAB30